MRILMRVARAYARLAIILMIGSGALAASRPVRHAKPKQASPSPATPYINPLYGLRFTPPSGWVQSANPDAVVVFMEPMAQTAGTPLRPARESNAQFLARINRELKQPAGGPSGFRANITLVSTLAAVKSIREYARITRDKAARMGDSYRIIGETPSRLGGAEAIRRTIRLVSGSTLVQSSEISALHNGRLYILALAASPARYDTCAAQFDRVLTTFSWK